MKIDDDRDLRELYAALRRQEERAAPAFAGVRALATHDRRGPHSPWVLLGLATAAAALVAGAFFLFRIPVRPGPSVTEWKAPTDFLLQIPGQEILRTLPRIGRSLPEASIEPTNGLQAPARPPGQSS